MEEQPQLEQKKYQSTPPINQKKDRSYLRWFLLVLVVLLLLAGTGFGVYAYEKSQSDEREAKLNTQITDLKTQVSTLNKTVNNLKADQTAKVTDNLPSSVVHIPDLGLNVTVPGELADLTSEVIHLAGDQAVNSVVLSSKTAEQAGCTKSSAPLGYLTYDNDKGGVMVATARGSNLYYLNPTTTCKDVTANDITMLQTALKSLVADSTR